MDLVIVSIIFVIVNSNERLSTADKGISEEQGQNERKSMDSR